MGWARLCRGSCLLPSCKCVARRGRVGPGVVGGWMELSEEGMELSEEGRGGVGQVVYCVGASG